MKRLIRLFTSGCLLTLLTACASVPSGECQVDIAPISPVPVLPRPRFDTVSRQNMERETQVWQLLEAAGCDRLYREKIKRSRFHNLVCEIDGQQESMILIGAHYDRLGSGDGIADNWTGILVMSNLAAHYAEHRPLHRMRFVAFGEEEIDMRGSIQHARTLAEQGDLPRVMVNVDTLGVSTLSLDRRASRTLNCLAQSVAEQQQVGLRTTLVRDSTGDWTSFAARGVPVVTFHSVNQHETKKLHTWQDKESLVDLERLNDAHRVIAELVSAIDHSIDLTLNL